MIKLKILSSFQSKLYSDFHPFFRWQKQLREQGIHFEMYDDYNKMNLKDTDTLLIYNRFFRKQFKEEEQLIKCLVELKKKAKKLIWFDAADSSGTMDFSLIPYVDTFLKKQVLKDKAYYTGENGNKHVRIWLDPNAEQIQLTLCPINETHKIKVSWNLGYFDYRPFNTRLKFLISNKVGYWFYPNQFHSPDNHRPLDLMFRGQINYNENQVSFQRNKVISILQTSTMKIAHGDIVPRAHYLKELSMSKVSISPFGWGEMCYRDFETFICGAILIKPSVEHLDTFPNIFVKNETYIPVRWDLNDLKDTAEDIVNNYSSYKHIAENGQDAFQRSLNDAQGFVRQIKHIIE
jgi:hypothetical protein